MKKRVLPATPFFPIGVILFLLCVAVSSNGAGTPVSSRTAAVAKTRLELSVNIVGQREDRTGAVSGVPVREGGVLQSHDNLQVHFSTNRDAYVCILMFDAKGGVQQLFPDPKVRSGRKVGARVDQTVPSEGEWFWLDENTGSETISVLASLTPLNDIRGLLNEMETSGRKKREEISRRVRQRVRSLESATSAITAGETKSFRLKDGTTIQSVTDIARGERSAVRTIRFAHIDGEAVRTAGAERGAGEKAEKRETSPGDAGITLRGADAALADALEKARQGSGDEKNIAELLGKVKENTALEETRGIGGIQIYKQLSPAVVLVATKEGLGSGSVIDKKGTVVTNWHVVKGYDRVVVFFKPANSRALTKKDAYAAQVVKVDEISDLALLRIDSPPSGMSVAKLGSMKDLTVGQEVHAIGHPDGETWTYTKGIISQIRPVYQWSYDDGVEHKASVIQTQTPINPGNSGGPLLDGKGEIIGVNSFTKEGEGLNFAVSVNVVKTFLQTKESRVAEKPPAPEWIKNSKFYDVHKNANGTVDVIGVDTRRNGDIDFYLVLDTDGSPKYVEFDRPDGSVELRMYDTDGDGTWKTYAFYDEKSEVYLIGISDHGDGKINRYEDP